jgi:hypothetical protein
MASWWKAKLTKRHVDAMQSRQKSKSMSCRVYQMAKHLSLHNQLLLKKIYIGNLHSNCILYVHASLIFMDNATNLPNKYFEASPIFDLKAELSTTQYSTIRVGYSLDRWNLLD